MMLLNFVKSLCHRQFFLFTTAPWQKATKISIVYRIILRSYCLCKLYLYTVNGLNSSAENRYRMLHRKEKLVFISWYIWTKMAGSIFDSIPWIYTCNGTKTNNTTYYCKVGVKRKNLYDVSVEYSRYFTSGLQVPFTGRNTNIREHYKYIIIITVNLKRFTQYN